MYYRVVFTLLLLAPGLAWSQTPLLPHLISDSALMVRQVETADINGDGATDVVALYQGNLVWFENEDGEGSFGPPLPIWTPHGPDYGSFLVRDVDGDGDADVVKHETASQSLFWIENTDGQGTFGAQHTLIPPSGDDLLLFDLVDLNSDGLLDVVVFLQFFETRLVWFEHLANGSFGPETLLLDPLAWAYELNTLDVDLDGDQDLCAVVFDGSNKRLILLKNLDGLGSLSPPMALEILPAMEQSNALLVGLVNGDAYEDIVFARESDFGTTALRYYENDSGNGTFLGPEIIGNSSHLADAALTDLDGDGAMDVVNFVLANYNEATQNYLSWVRNEGGDFSEEIELVSNFDRPASLATGRINSDVAVDLVAAFADSIVWFGNGGNLGLESPTIEAVSVYPNPTQGTLHLHVRIPYSQLEVFNVLGQRVHFSLPTEILDLSPLPSGNYFLKLWNGTSVLGMVRVVRI